ncbi:MAG: phospholipase D-like domain-containing protein [Candidatus Sulfobium sp.]|jgi:cardiolipin synthase
MLERIADIWPYVASTLALLVTVLASGHVILYKRDTHAAVAWVGLIWLLPVFGAVLYLLLGINRIRRRARSLRGERRGHTTPVVVRPEFTGARGLAAVPPGDHYPDLVRLVDVIVQKPVLEGNNVLPLVNGDEAYPAMIKAAGEARNSLSLSTYIFDRDEAGRSFLQALSRAVTRGVEVRVLIDAVGVRYSWPPMDHLLRQAGIRVARFMPTVLPWRMPFMNLRNHRKILVVDGRKGFTGGMNIRSGHVIGSHPHHPVQDLHFSVDGPVVAHFQEVFAEDWYFATGESLEGEKWFPSIERRGMVAARGIPDGPDEDFEKLLWTIQGALACSKSSVKIMTPYFLPDSDLMRALGLAAMRGVTVDIILPSVNNIPFIHWASKASFAQLIEEGCRIWLSPPPFDHTKLMVVDGIWVLFGSGNWDPRSLMLNFEFNVESYSRELASRLTGLLIEPRIANSERVTLDAMEGRAFPVKLRDGIARLFSPYL